MIFRDEYFGGDYEACDNAIEIDDGYIAFTDGEIYGTDDSVADMY